MCYPLAAIIIVPRGMDGVRKQIKERKCLVCCSVTLATFHANCLF